MHTRTRFFLSLIVLICLAGLLSCGRRGRETATPTTAAVSRTSPAGGSEDAAKLGFHTSEAVGRKEYVVILADFPDVERTIDLETLEERMLWFLSEYFNQASYGNLVYEGTMVGPYELPVSVEDYKISPKNLEVDRSRVLKLVNDVINLADDDVTFSKDLYVMISLGATGVEYGMVGFCAVPGMLGFATDNPPTTKSGEEVTKAVVFCEMAHLGTYIHDNLHIIGGLKDNHRLKTT